MAMVTNDGGFVGGGDSFVWGVVRLVIGLPFAAVVTAALFLMMRDLILPENVPATREVAAVQIDITSNRRDSDVTIRNRRPEQPEQVRTPPAPPRIEAAPSERPAESMATVLGSLPEIQPEEVDQSDFQVVISDRDEQPLVRLEPQYPRRAGERRLEGRCTVFFDVNADGTTANIRADCTAEVFVNASVRAVQGWRYQPRVVSGEAVTRRNLSVDFPFILDQSGATSG